MHLFAAGTRTGLWIDGQPELRWITRSHLVREMTAWGVPAPTAADVVDTTLSRLADALPAAAHALGPLLPPSIVDDVLQRFAGLRQTG